MYSNVMLEQSNVVTTFCHQLMISNRFMEVYILFRSASNFVDETLLLKISFYLNISVDCNTCNCHYISVKKCVDGNVFE